MIVTKNDHPDLFVILRAAGFRRHKAIVFITESVKLQQPYWDGGSKDEHFALHLPSGQTSGVKLNHNPWPQQPAVTTVDVVPGRAIVTGGTFRGKSAFWTLYLHPEDAKRVLEPVAE